MTGFGYAETNVQDKSITVEIKSVNHRYCEVVTRLPRNYIFLEENIRRLIQRRIARGRLDVFLNITEEKTALAKVDKELAIAYHKFLRELGDLLQISPEITAEQLIRLQGVLVFEEKKEDLDEFWSMLEPVINQALDELIKMRETEGYRLEQDIIHRIGKIEQFINEISEQEPQVVENYRERLTARIKELVVEEPFVEERIAAEVILFAERCNITEELVRIKSHLQQLRRVIDSNEPAGRKMEFLLQELYRETNTIGSKGNDVKISHNVVEIKSELEKIREQIQNVE